MDDKELLKEAREALKQCVDDEQSERALMKDDLRFATLDQWPEDIRKDRENDLENGPRPCLTIDKYRQYRTQVVNDMRQGKPGINVRPQDDAADVDTAKIIKGMIRNIEDQSKADISYSTGGGMAVDIGLGFWRVTTEYVADDSFDQEIFIRPIPNTFSVYLGPHIMPDGSDAKRAFIVESMPLEKFKNEYPGKKYKGEEFSDLGDQYEYWHTGEMVTVVEYFFIERTRKTLYFLADGTTITEEDYGKWPESEGVKPLIQDERTTFKEQLRWCKMTGVEVLEKRDLPSKYIPIVEVVGNESVVDGKRRLWGMVRPSKDSLRMYNYWASTLTEKFGLAPKTPFIGTVGQFATDGAKWAKANRVNYPFLQADPVDVNGNQAPMPQRQGPTPMEAGLVQHMQVIEHDVQTALGMFKAAVGETESQQSGRAILALQKESDTGTYHFGANQGVSIRHTGVIILDMIPHYYDTKRIVRIIGEDGTVETAQIDPSQQESKRQIQGPKGIQNIYNPGVGKFDISISVGPSYNTKRMEAAATLTEVVKSQPQLMPLIGDLLFRSLDFPYSDQIAERLKKMLPPPLQDSEGDPGVKLMQAMQKMQMMGAQMQEMQQENVQLKAGTVQGMAKVKVDEAAQQEKARLAREETDAELKLQKEKQDNEVQLARDKAIDEFNLKAECARKECDLAKEVQDRKHALEREGSEFAMKMKAQDAMPPEVAAQHYKQELMQTDVMPVLMENLQGAFSKLGESLNKMVQLQQQTIVAIQAPKSVSVGGIQKDAAGNIIGATVKSKSVLARMN